MTGVDVLWIGDPRREEFREAFRSTRQRCRVESAVDVDEAIVRLVGERSGESPFAPELCVIAQVRPNEVAFDQIAGLRRAAPLVRIVAMLGSWCDGEARTGEPWPADLRVAWHEWPARLERQLAVRLRGACPAWGMPSTATDDERTLMAADEADGAPESNGSGPRVLVAAPSMAAVDWLAAACCAKGWRPIIYTPDSGSLRESLTAAIWDAPLSDASRHEQLEKFVAEVAPTPVIALLNFPRAEDVVAARAAGATAVMAKPLGVDELLAALERSLAAASR